QDRDQENRNADQQDGLIAPRPPAQRHVVKDAHQRLPLVVSSQLYYTNVPGWRTRGKKIGGHPKRRQSRKQHLQGGVAAWPSSLSGRSPSSRTATAASSSPGTMRSASSGTRASSTLTAIFACTRAAPPVKASPSPRSRNGCCPT